MGGAGRGHRQGGGVVKRTLERGGRGDFRGMACVAGSELVAVFENEAPCLPGATGGHELRAVGEPTGVFGE